MNKKVMCIVVGSLIAQLGFQFYRYKKNKEELEEIEKIHKMTENLSDRLTKSINEPYVKQIKEYGDRTIDQYIAHADKVIEDFNKALDEMQKTDSILNEAKNRQIEIEKELAKLD